MNGHAPAGTGGFAPAGNPPHDRRGLNLNLFIYADGHNEATFADEVVPILRRRGLFRTAYEGTMLRDHYGLPRPESGFALAQRQSSAA